MSHARASSRRLVDTNGSRNSRMSAPAEKARSAAPVTRIALAYWSARELGERFAKLPAHRVVHHVQHGGAIEGDGGHTILLLNDDCLVAHSRSYASNRPVTIGEDIADEKTLGPVTRCAPEGVLSSDFPPRRVR